MTACAPPELSVPPERPEQGASPPPVAADGEDDPVPRTLCAISAEGAYAARLAGAGDALYPERWTLDGPEPYAVPLPGSQPEDPGTEVQPMGDGRVLVRRLVDGRHMFSLLYPTGPGTGELPLGAVECPDAGTRLWLLPPAPGGERAYALMVGPSSSAVWLVAGGAFGPEHVAAVPGRCSGGVWLDRTGRMLALDREADGRTKTVVVDLERDGEISPLLQIAADSDDRLLFADPDSGLLLIGSDAPSPGVERLGWGVLGSALPVRFPHCLRMTVQAPAPPPTGSAPGPAAETAAGTNPEAQPNTPSPEGSSEPPRVALTVTPFAVQPGQVLTPERCAVALRVDGPTGCWVGVWRPAERQVRHLAAPQGWLTGTGLFTPEGELQLPFSTPEVPCGVARVPVPVWESAITTDRTSRDAASGIRTERTEGYDTDGRGQAFGTGPGSRSGTTGGDGHADADEGAVRDPAGVEGAAGPAAGAPDTGPPQPVVPRPVPLQQAPLGGLVTK
ncbi:hypothetical protein [Streptomyces sp. NPDC008150]|uniref:hypothetical protein n=1 Tax=Streptomyces sp. NPDC008150 TaxID=3364816 RepID=UPI0036EDA246